MMRTWGAVPGAAIALVGLMVSSASAQDAKTIISNASEAMGVDNLNSITYDGSGANVGLGQSNNANGRWPRTNVNDVGTVADIRASLGRK